MKTVGIVARIGEQYTRSSIYMFDNFRRICFLNNVIPYLILPPQTVDYHNSTGQEIGELSESDKMYLMECVNKCDGIIMPGGNRYFNFDKFIYKYAKEIDKPVLGICMGMQIMAGVETDTVPVSIGNDSHYQRHIDYAHDVTIDEHSKLYDIFHKTQLSVNSYHYYVVNDGRSFKTVGRSPEGFVEAMEIPDKKFIIGVQWHPEIMYDYDLDNQKLMQAFFKAL